MIYKIKNKKIILMGLLVNIPVAFSTINSTEDISPAPSVEVECNVQALSAAISAGNLAEKIELQLPSECFYVIENPATANEALPVITGDIRIVGGGNNTVIARNLTAAQFRIFKVAAGGRLTLRKLTIENGDTTGLGGGIANYGTLLLQNVNLSHNKAKDGGGIYIANDATGSVFHSRFLFNSATGGGGGIFNSGKLFIYLPYFYGNDVATQGGAVYTKDTGMTTVSRGTFAYNKADTGGAFYNEGKTTISQSTLQINTANVGGGIATINAKVVLNNLIIMNNTPNNCTPVNTIDGCVD